VPQQAVVAAGRSPEGQSASGSETGRIVRSRAPLRLGLAGGGTDVSPFCDRYGGLVLNATIDRYCYTTVEERADDSVVLASTDQEIEETVGSDPGQLSLHAAAYRRVCDTFDLPSPAVSITTLAEAPPGSGLGSSSTLVVSIIEALREYFNLPMGEYEIAKMAYQVERVDCRLEGGRQDQYAATFGGFNMMEFFSDDRTIVQPLRLKPAVVNEFEASLVLYHTGVSRSSSEIISEQTRHIAANDQERIQSTLALKEEAASMREALLVGDLRRVAEVLHGGWLAKRQIASGISTPHIEEIFEIAKRHGALAGKVSGAGGGGYILFLVDPHRRSELTRALNDPDGSVEPAHFVPDGAVSWQLR
jgi:D-glycero-alpha-D-manno-heptose-7-phosphate kinase